MSDIQISENEKNLQKIIDIFNNISKKNVSTKSASKKLKNTINVNHPVN